MKLYIFFIIFILNSYFLMCEEPFWEYLNGPPTGRVYDIRESPNGEIYICGVNGVFLSTDEGMKWDQIYKGSVYYMDVTFSGYIFIITYIGKKILYSSDLGKSWEETYDVLENDGILPYFISLNKDGKMFMLGKKDHIFIVLYSDNNGKSWNLTNFQLNENINEDDYITLWEINKDTNGSPIIGGFITDKELGQSTKHYGLLYIFSNDYTSYKEIILPSTVQDMDFINSNEIIAACSENTTLTRDSGNTWEIILDIKTKSVRALNENEFLCGTIYEGVYYTSDKGKTWEKRNVGLRYEHVPVLAKGSNGNIYAGTWTGFYVSTNKGISWENRSKGFTAANIEGISFDSKGCVYAVDWGVFRSCDHGETWEYLGLGDYLLTEILITKKDEILVGSSRRLYGIIRSDDYGKTWEKSSTGIPELAPGEYNEVEDIMEASDGSIYASPWSVYRSTDGGRNWKGPESGGGYYGYSIAENSEGHIFSGNDDSAISRSTDKGKTWTIVNPTQWLEPGNRGDVFFIKGTTIGYKGFIPWKTIDNGRGWMKMYGSERIKGDHFAQDSLGTIYSCSAGVFRSFDNFNTYEKLYGEENGLSHILFKDIEVSPDGYIYLGVENGGMYRSRNRFVSVKEPKKEEISFDIMPIPAEDILKINYDCPLCKIEIYTLLGTKLIEIPYTEEIDVSWLSPGIYIIRIGDKVRKFVVSR